MLNLTKYNNDGLKTKFAVLYNCYQILNNTYPMLSKNFHLGWKHLMVLYLRNLKEKRFLYSMSIPNIKQMFPF